LIKIIFSLYGRHRRTGHPRALESLKLIKKDLRNYHTFSSTYFYFFLVKTNLLKFFIFICFILNKFSFIQIKLIFSDHEAIKFLVNKKKSFQRKFFNLLINFFWNDYREVKNYKNFSKIIYVVGGDACIVRNKSFNFFQYFPVIKNIQNFSYNKNLIFYTGNVFYSVNEMILNLKNIDFSKEANSILYEIIKYNSFDELSVKKSYYLNIIRKLKNQNEILCLWSIYCNMLRTLFFYRLKLSSLKNKIFAIGTRLIKDFKFTGLENNYSHSLIKKYISQAKVNLDLGSQLMESAFYERSNIIFEVSPASILQYEKPDHKNIFTSSFAQCSFKFFGEFEKIVKQRFNEDKSDYYQRNFQINQNIGNIIKKIM
jgi:hypothetical protein